ncbi:hypothetical protein MC885_013358 [Smutsia gigantea]|nr:hypothetical protein MC885_013358 [Smutsia gigantea]
MPLKGSSRLSGLGGPAEAGLGPVGGAGVVVETGSRQYGAPLLGPGGAEDMLVERMDRRWSDQATEASGPAGTPPGRQCFGAPGALSWVAAGERKGSGGLEWGATEHTCPAVTRSVPAVVQPVHGLP